MSGCRQISELLNSYFVSVFSEEEGGDLLKSSYSFPGTPEEELGTESISQTPGTACAPGWAQPRAGHRGCSGLQPHPATEPPLSGTVAKNPHSNPSGHFSPAV